MVQDRLNEAVMRRLQELGLPPSLIEIAEFRDSLLRGWVMFVRDGDMGANVHLIEPQPSATCARSPKRKKSGRK